MDKCERCNQGEEHVYCCHNCEKFAAEIAVLSIEKRDIKAAYDEQVKTGLELESQRDAALLQVDELRRLAKAAFDSNGGFVTTLPAWQDLLAALRVLTEKRICETCGGAEKDYGGKVGSVCPKCNGMCG